MNLKNDSNEILNDSKTENEFSRTELLIGSQALQKLKNSYVAIFGIGGVGSYVCEALARSGISSFDLIDNDKVNITNINRQLIATHKTIGEFKVDVMKNRILDINPNAKVNVHKCFFLPENSDLFDFTKYDYIVDAVDTVSAKIEIILKANQNKIPVISSMGAGNKLDATAFKVSDIYQTKVCPLARIMRQELKKRNIKSLKVIYSEEKPKRAINNNFENESQTLKKQIPSSIAFIPSVVGLIIAGEVIKDLIK